jgi:hypothetical protein
MFFDEDAVWLGDGFLIRVVYKYVHNLYLQCKTVVLYPFYSCINCGELFFNKFGHHKFYIYL